MTAQPTAAPDRFDTASDWCNPILVKEVRQAVKSRAFIATFSLLLLGAWLVAAFGLLSYGPAIEYGRAGQYFFGTYLLVLSVAMFVVVPFGAFRSLLNERDENTYELLSITTLSPGQIVRGKWACALVQGGLFYSAIAPFIAFTSLLQGFDFAQAAFLLAVTFWFSAGMSLVALTLGTAVRQRVWQGFLSLAVLGGLLFFLLTIFSAFGGTFIGPLPFDDDDFWWATGIGMLMTGSYMVLCYQIASARLTFEAENRSTGIRLTAAAQFWLLWIGFALYHAVKGVGVEDDELIGLVILSGLHWAFCGLSFSAEPDGLSRRVRRSIPRPVGLRGFLAPLLPGGARGYLFVLGHLVALWLLTAVFWACAGPASSGLFFSSDFAGRLLGVFTFDSDLWDDAVMPLVTAVCAYIALYAGLTAAFRRWGGNLFASFGAAHARTVVVILIAAGIVGPMAVRTGRLVRYNETSVADALFPFWLIVEIIEGQDFLLPLSLVVMTAIVVIGLNVSAMVRGVALVLEGPVAPRRRPTGNPLIGPNPDPPVIATTETSGATAAPAGA